MADPETTPIAEANPASLDELFSRDPLDLADTDLDKMVAELEAQRLAWESNKPATKVKAEAKTKAKAKLSLADMGWAGPPEDP